MKKPQILRNKKRLVFLGVGGVGMSALAKFCVKAGYEVSGYDMANSSATCELKSQGMFVTADKDKINIGNDDAVIYTSALIGDELLKTARLQNAAIIKRSELLGSVLKLFTKSVAVSGSHGKTTTTAMIAHILTCAKMQPTCFIGGEDRVFGNFLCGDDKIAVAEACEYKKNFLDLTPQIAVVTNIDNDHLDSFGNIENEIEAFCKFTHNSLCVFNADDKNSRVLSEETSVSFGIENLADISATDISRSKSKYSFTVKKGSFVLGRITLSVCGLHNIYNALAAIAVADILNVRFTVVKKALENFHGVKRREEYLGRVGDLGGAEVYADYAHHPSEIKAVADSLFVGNNDVVVFQPHTYSRTRLLLEDFLNALKDIPNLIIYKTYPAREAFDAEGSAHRLYMELTAKNKKVRYAESPEELFSFLEGDKKRERFLFLGAGDIYDIAKRFIREFDKGDKN